MRKKTEYTSWNWHAETRHSDRGMLGVAILCEILEWNSSYNFDTICNPDA